MGGDMVASTWPKHAPGKFAICRLAMSVPQQPQQQQVILQQAAEPSLMSKCACAAKKADAVTMGAMMGSLVGLTIGFIGGGFQILR